MAAVAGIAERNVKTISSTYGRRRPKRIQRWPKSWVSSWWCRYASGSRACAACYTSSRLRGSRRWPSRSGHRFDSDSRRSPRGSSVSRCRNRARPPRPSPDPPTLWPSYSATTWLLDARSCHHYTRRTLFISRIAFALVTPMPSARRASDWRPRVASRSLDGKLAVAWRSRHVKPVSQIDIGNWPNQRFVVSFRSLRKPWRVCKTGVLREIYRGKKTHFPRINDGELDFTLILH